jgi:hypothetical protein
MYVADAITKQSQPNRLFILLYCMYKGDCKRGKYQYFYKVNKKIGRGLTLLKLFNHFQTGIIYSLWCLMLQ